MPVDMRVFLPLKARPCVWLVSLASFSQNFWALSFCAGSLLSTASIKKERRIEFCLPLNMYWSQEPHFIIIIEELLVNGLSNVYIFSKFNDTFQAFSIYHFEDIVFRFIKIIVLKLPGSTKSPATQKRIKSWKKV